jgi:predicted ribosome quality control (RQC) complex YloA/Tae2 family protein
MIHKTIHFEKIKENIDFYVGENAEENQHIVLNADPEDLWFHLADKSSPHVLAMISDKNIDRKYVRLIVVQGSLLCKQNSKCKSDKKVDIIYTKMKNVIPTETVGSVQTSNTKHIII